MALSAFDDRSRPPSGDDLAAVLGTTYPLWSELRGDTTGAAVPLSEEWSFTSKTIGWGLRLKRGPRIILSMIPRDGHFLASFVLGEKAVRCVHDSALPAAVIEQIANARRYAEGRGVRLEVNDAADVAAVRILATIKMAN